MGKKKTGRRTCVVRFCVLRMSSNVDRRQEELLWVRLHVYVGGACVYNEKPERAKCRAGASPLYYVHRGSGLARRMERGGGRM